MFKILKDLWKDEEGAILSAEYLTLGGIVALGSAAGMAEVRNSVNAECKDYGLAVHEINSAARASAIASIRSPQTGESTQAATQYRQSSQRDQEYQFMTP